MEQSLGRCTQSCAFSRRQTLWISFAVGCLVIMVSSSIASFNTYASDLKIEFGLTQLQVEVIAACGTMGQSAALPTGILLERVGSRLALLFGTVFLVPSYILLWESNNFINFFRYHPFSYILLDLYMLFVGIGSTILYLAALTVNLNNFPRRHRGKVIGFLSALFWVGPAVFNTLYNAGYKHVDINGYFLVLALMTLVVSVLGAIFITKINRHDSDPDYDEMGNRLKSRDHIYVEAINAPAAAEYETEVSLTGMELLKNPTFHLLTWSFLLSTSIGIVFLNNQGIIIDSCENNHFENLTGLLCPLLAAVGNALSGVLSDRYAKTIPREFYVIVVGFLQTIVMFFCIFGVCQQEITILALCVGYLSYGVNFTIFPALVCHYFGMQHFSRNWGAVMLAYGIFSGLGLLTFGIFYDAEIFREESIRFQCYGEHCFEVVFIIGTVQSLISLILICLQLYCAIMSINIAHEQNAKPRVITERRYQSFNSICEDSTKIQTSRPAHKSWLNIHASQIIRRSYSMDSSQQEIPNLKNWLRTYRENQNPGQGQGQPRERTHTAGSFDSIPD